MAQLPEVVRRQWVQAVVRWLRELGFTAPEGPLRAVLDDLAQPAPARSPSTGKPGRHVIHGRYCRRGAAELLSKHGGDGAGQEGRP
jgi:hypothetical protein